MDNWQERLRTICIGLCQLTCGASIMHSAVASASHTMWSLPQFAFGGSIMTHGLIYINLGLENNAILNPRRIEHRAGIRREQQGEGVGLNQDPPAQEMEGNPTDRVEGNLQDLPPQQNGMGINPRNPLLQELGMADNPRQQRSPDRVRLDNGIFNFGVDDDIDAEVRPVLELVARRDQGPVHNRRRELVQNVPAPERPAYPRNGAARPAGDNEVGPARAQPLNQRPRVQDESSDEEVAAIPQPLPLREIARRVQDQPAGYNHIQGESDGRRCCSRPRPDVRREVVLVEYMYEDWPGMNEDVDVPTRHVNVDPNEAGPAVNVDPNEAGPAVNVDPNEARPAVNVDPNEAGPAVNVNDPENMRERIQHIRDRMGINLIEFEFQERQENWVEENFVDLVEDVRYIDSDSDDD